MNTKEVVGDVFTCRDHLYRLPLLSLSALTSEQIQSSSPPHPYPHTIPLYSTPCLSLSLMRLAGKFMNQYTLGFCQDQPLSLSLSLSLSHTHTHTHTHVHTHDTRLESVLQTNSTRWFPPVFYRTTSLSFQSLPFPSQRVRGLERESEREIQRVSSDRASTAKVWK